MNEVQEETRRPDRRPLWIVLALLIVHSCWLAWSATWQSPTLNEPGHLASGIAHWTLGRFEPYAVNPPLVRMVAALPVLSAGYVSDWKSFRGKPGDRPEFTLGSDFINANAERSQRLFVLARWACIPFSLVGAWMCFIWGRALYRDAAGVLACGLWCVEPNILAHGQLITPDVAATSFGLVAMWTFWKWLCRPGFLSAAVAGVGLALAILAKFSWLVLFGLWPILWLLALWRRPAGETQVAARQAMQGILIVVVALYIVNMVYGFDGSFSPLDSFEFRSQAMSGEAEPGKPGNRFAGRWVGRIPVPFPRQFLVGLDLQKKDFERFPHQSYLRGEWRQGGWWYYYVYAAAVKTPVGLWLLAVTSILVRFRPGRPPGSIQARIGECVLLLPAVVLFVIVSSETEFNHHFRYVIPCFGPVFVLASGALARAGRGLRWWCLLCWTWIAAASALVAPANLSYFNELAGGMRKGGTHLLHSNVDWGQDLVALKKWMTQHPEATPVYLAYYGFYDPLVYGIPAETSPQGPFWESRPIDWSFRPGWYAVSVNYLHGTAWRMQNPHAYRPLLSQEPVAWCGGSIAVYRVDESLARQLTEAVTQPRG